MTGSQVSRHKGAELASSTGAGVLGAGLGVLLSPWAAPYASLLLVVGVLLHGWGMLEKHRLEKGIGTPAWSRVLYWSCWAALAVLIIAIGLTALRG
jgi:hypothetical protein